MYVGSSINLTKRMVTYYYYNSDMPSKLVIIRATSAWDPLEAQVKKYGLD